LGSQAVELIDTSVLLAGPGVGGEGWAISVVTHGELEFGVLAAPDATERGTRSSRLEALLADLDVLPVDRAVASEYAKLRAETGRRPSNDLWIAATAIAAGLTLVTADERQSKLPGVRSRYVQIAT
jgi:predicted nucleic acid-binding protein